jgi:hypothetical protein
MATPVRFPNGVGNVSVTDPLGRMGMLDPTKYIVDFEDFNYYTAGDWTVTETQAGATQAISNSNTLGPGGILLLTNSAADNDVNQIQRVGESFKFTAGKETWFKARVRVSNATETDVYVGLVITDADVVGAVTDGVYFRKDDDSTGWDIVSLMDSAGSTQTNVGTLVANTWVVLAFYYNGGTEIQAFIDGAKVATLTVAAGTSLVNDEELAVLASLTNGSAAAHTMAIDYLFAAQER